MNFTSASFSSHSSSSSLTSLQQQQQKGGLSSENNHSSLGSRSSKILRNRTPERRQSQAPRTFRTSGNDALSNEPFGFLPVLGKTIDSNEEQQQYQPWQSPTYKFGVPLNEFQPACDFLEGCDGSDDAINSSMSMASECSLNTTSSSLEEHVLQLLESYQPDGNGSVRAACENPVARILLRNSSFSDEIQQDDVSNAIASPRRNSSPAAVGSSPPENVHHRPAALHASASAPVLYFSPRPC